MDEEVGQLAEQISALLDRRLWALPDAELVDTLVTVSRLADQLAVVCAGLTREIDARSLYTADGSSSVAVWLRDRLRIGVRSGRHLAALGRLLDERPALRDAIASGRTTVEQADVIGTSVALLPAEVEPAVRDAAEQALLAHADRFGPGLLHRLGQRILDHVAPDTAEAALRARLEAEERRAQACRHVTLTPAGDGRTRLTGWLDTEAAALVGAAIDPLSKPVPGVAGQPDLRTPGQRRADALAEVCRLALACGQLPDCG
ncbi:MAG TPA: DUF222 domain-containing protein, partial [Micromonosporaceae bacterium]|nr:DUF222 domain-containing protein [Micromonosporaceae bacterium]